MRFLPSKLAGVFVVDPEPRGDDRGLFARTWCRDEFAGHHLDTNLVQCNVSFNRLAGTLRGLHWQAAPHEEVKLVRCTAGAAWDVVVDVRPGSPTFGQWEGFDITAENRLGVYIPGGCAHGFQTYVDGTELFYQMSAFYHAEASRGVRWNDPRLAVAWPACAQRIMNDRDANLPHLEAVCLAAS